MEVAYLSTYLVDSLIVTTLVMVVLGLTVKLFT